MTVDLTLAPAVLALNKEGHITDIEVRTLLGLPPKPHHSDVVAIEQKCPTVECPMWVMTTLRPGDVIPTPRFCVECQTRQDA